MRRNNVKKVYLHVHVCYSVKVYHAYLQGVCLAHLSRRRTVELVVYLCLRPPIIIFKTTSPLNLTRGWTGGAKVLGKLPVPGRPTNLAYSRARAYCAFRRCGWGLFGHFSLIYHFSFLSPSLWKTARYRLKYCLKGPLSPKQPTNQMNLTK